MSGISGAGGIESSQPQETIESSERSPEVREVAESIEKATLKPEEIIETEGDIKGSEDLEAAFTAAMDTAPEMAAAAQQESAEGTGAAQQTEKTEKAPQAAEGLDAAVSEAEGGTKAEARGAAREASETEAAESTPSAAITLEAISTEGQVTIEPPAGDSEGAEGIIIVGGKDINQEMGIIMEDKPAEEGAESIVLQNMPASESIPGLEDPQGFADQSIPATSDSFKAAEPAAIIDTNDGVSAEAIIDTNDGTSRAAAEGGARTEDREAIIDTNDGVSAEAIIDTNDTDFVKGGENLAAAEPPTWSGQMDQGGAQEIVHPTSVDEGDGSPAYVLDGSGSPTSAEFPGYIANQESLEQVVHETPDFGEQIAPDDITPTLEHADQNIPGEREPELVDRRGTVLETEIGSELPGEQADQISPSQENIQNIINEILVGLGERLPEELLELISPLIERVAGLRVEIGILENEVMELAHELEEAEQTISDLEPQKEHYDSAISLMEEGFETYYADEREYELDQDGRNRPYQAQVYYQLPNGESVSSSYSDAYTLLTEYREIRNDLANQISEAQDIIENHPDRILSNMSQIQENQNEMDELQQQIKRLEDDYFGR